VTGISDAAFNAVKAAARPPHSSEIAVGQPEMAVPLGAQRIQDYFGVMSTDAWVFSHSMRRVQPFPD
jgi:hypothetical protein